MARYLPAALVLGLLVATGLAFIYTELLKLEPSPIRSTHVEPLVSPTCHCPTDRARVAFRLRKSDVVTVTIVDSAGRDVRVLAAERPVRRLQTATFAWRGRAAGDRPAPDGLYHARVRLELAEKTITLPNEIRVDSTRPKVTIVSVRPRAISPDHDGRNEYVSVAYTLGEPGHAVLRVNGTRRVLGKVVERGGRLDWFGRIDGRPVAPGSYRLSVVGIDLAGNRSLPAPAGTVRVRYIDLGRDSAIVLPRGVVRVPVLTDAKSYRWRLAGRSATGRGRVLVLHAPARPGRYVLFVDARGHADRMVVRVRKPPRHRAARP